MKALLFCVALAALSGCAAKMAASDCETLGYLKGTPEFQACAERQLAARQKSMGEFRQQQTDVKIECERSSRSLFGRRTGTRSGNCY